MTYKKLLAAARGMGDAEVAGCLKGLAADPRFAAVLALVDQIKEQTADAACDHHYAEKHGTLEHAAGVRFGLRILEGKIKGMIEPPKRSGQQRPPEE